MTEQGRTAHPDQQVTLIDGIQRLNEVSHINQALIKDAVLFDASHTNKTPEQIVAYRVGIVDQVSPAMGEVIEILRHTASYHKRTTQTKNG